MSLPLVLLKGAARAVESAAVKESIGDASSARDDARLGLQLLAAAIGLDRRRVAELLTDAHEDHAVATRRGHVAAERAALLRHLVDDTEPRLSHDLDTRPSDDGEARA